MNVKIVIIPSTRWLISVTSTDVRSILKDCSLNPKDLRDFDENGKKKKA